MPFNWSDAASLVMAEFKNQTDRGVAIVGGAMVDDCLTEAIRKKINSREKDDKDAMDDLEFLFSVEGPLMSTKARSSLAYLLGIIGSETRSDLKHIAKIRNKFAHWILSPDDKKTVQTITFHDPQVSGWIGLLKAPKRSLILWNSGIDEQGIELPVPMDLVLRLEFTRTVTAIWLGLEFSDSDLFDKQILLP